MSILVGWEIAQLVKCLPHSHDNIKNNPLVVALMHLSARSQGREPGRLWGLLVSQVSLALDQVKDHLKNTRWMASGELL